MARGNNLEKMSYAELAEMESDIARLKSSKQAEERTALKERLMAEAEKHGFDINELFGGRGRGGKGMQSCDQIPGPEQSFEHLDWPWPYAPLDDCSDQRREGEEG